MLQDYKLGLRMLRKYPGLTIAGGLALAIAIGIGAGWYDLAGKILWPAIPLPEGDRIVVIETQNSLTNEDEFRVARDFLEWQRDLRSTEDLGAFRAATRNLIVGDTPPVLLPTAELTAAAFRAARVPAVLGRGLLESDETPGAPAVVVLAHDIWQRALGGRGDVIGSVVRLGSTPVTVIGVMPEGFGYPVNQRAWTPLRLRASYGALEGGPIRVIGRLAPGVTREQADAELRVLGERAATALPATHRHLRSRVTGLDGGSTVSDITQLAISHVPSLLVLILACTTVGTLFYARTAIREGEIALRSALGATRARIVGQLFVEALVLASVAAAAGLVAADRALTWGIESVAATKGNMPFWVTPGLTVTTILYALGLAVLSAAMLSLLPAMRATRARVQPHLANLGTGGATLRFGRVWTTAMITQVALTAIAIPIAIEGASQAIRNVSTRGEFPSGEYFAARIDLDHTTGEELSPAALDERRTRAYAALERRIAKEPGVVAVTFADRVPGSLPPRDRTAGIEISPGAGPAFDYQIGTSAVGPGFFEAFDRPIVAGRAFHGGDFSAAAGSVVVNEAFVRGFLERGGGSAVGARLRYAERTAMPATEPWYEIVGIVRDFGLDPDDEGVEKPYVFHPAAAGTLPAAAMSVRMRGNSATLLARLPAIAAEVDSGLFVREARPLGEWIWRRDLDVITPAVVGAGVTMLVLFLSAMGIFSLLSVSVSRRTREIGLRMALGANPRRVLGEILRRAMVLMGSGTAAGGALVLLLVAQGAGPTGRPGDDLVKFAAWLGVTSAVMCGACLLACIAPARRALRINPIDALRDT